MTPYHRHHPSLRPHSRSLRTRRLRFEVHGHPDQLGEGGGSGFFHDARPVDLHGALTYPKIRGHDLVGFAANHEFEYLTFSRRQRREAGTNLRMLRQGTAAAEVAFERPLNPLN